MDLISATGLAVATLGGTAVGLERQWSGHASGPHARFGGIRTFSLLGAVGGLAGWLTTAGFLPLAVVLLAGATALVVAAYVAGRRTEIDGTTALPFPTCPTTAPRKWPRSSSWQQARSRAPGR